MPDWILLFKWYFYCLIEYIKTWIPVVFITLHCFVNKFLSDYILLQLSGCKTKCYQLWYYTNHRKSIHYTLNKIVIWRFNPYSCLATMHIMKVLNSGYTVGSHFKLRATVSHTIVEKKNEFISHVPYASAVGRLMYVVVYIRPGFVTSRQHD